MNRSICCLILYRNHVHPESVELAKATSFSYSSQKVGLPIRGILGKNRYIDAELMIIAACWSITRTLITAISLLYQICYSHGTSITDYP